MKRLFAYLNNSVVVLIMVIINHDTYNQRCHGAPCSETFYVIFGIMLIDQIIQMIFLCYRNLTEENIAKALHRILIYRKWIQMETIAGITTLCILLPIVMCWRNIHQTWFYIFGILLGLIGLGLTIFIYWYYMKNFRNIQQNLKELKEFEQETES